MAAWATAIPFFALMVAGSVVTRIGDMLLKDFVEDEYQRDKEKKEDMKREKEERKQEKKERKRNGKDV